MSRKWLVSSGGRRGALVELLKTTPGPASSMVVVTDASLLSAAGALADEFAVVPRIDDPNFVSEMLSVCKRYDIDAIVPTLDPELNVYARSRDLFINEGTDVLVSSPVVTQFAWDKWEFFKWLRSNGLPTVATAEAGSPDIGVISGPVVAKPRTGSASKGVLFADSVEDLPELSNDYIVQARANGIEITVDFAVSATGRFLGAVPRRRLEVRAGEVSKGVTIQLPKVEDTVRKLAEALPGAYGILNAQVFYDPSTHALSIIELNARVGGGFPLSAEAGANFFSALLTDSPIDSWRSNLVMLRYDSAVFVDGSEMGL